MDAPCYWYFRAFRRHAIFRREGSLPGEVMKALRDAIAIVILMIVATAILTTSVRGGEASIHSVVVEFQTLIAGCLAIVAAYMTVAQMRESDRKSDERHEQLLRLQLRSDGLMLDRAFFSVVPALRNLKFALETAQPLRLRHGDTFYEDVEAYRGTASEIARLADQAAACFKADRWKSAEHLFDGDFGTQVTYTHRDVYRLRNVASIAETTTLPDTSREYLLVGHEQRALREQAERKKAIATLPSEIQSCKDSLSKTLFNISQLSRSYNLAW